jgi:hypothetical protein
VRRSVRRLPLGGADLVLVAMQHLFNGGQVSNNTSLIVHCDGPLDPDRLRRAFDRFLDFCPWPAARLRRPFPWGQLHWAAGPRTTLVAPAIRHRSLTSAAELQAELEAGLNATIDPRRDPPLRLSVLDYVPEASRIESVLVVTWFHPLMDPRGGQNLLAHLAHLDQIDGGVAWQGSAPAFVAPPDPRPLRERGRLGRKSQGYLRGLVTATPVSPGTRLAASGTVRLRQQGFVDEDPPAGGERATREMAWRLAVVGKAMGELWRLRDLPDVPFLLPVSVDLRPKGDPGPTIGNVMAFHFARFTLAQTADVAGLARALREQMADAVRDGQIDANAVAMEFLKYRPLALMLHDLPGTAAGETFSFNCADLGDFPPSLEKFFGRRVVNAYHVPAVMPRPGVGVFFNRTGGRHNVVISWMEGAVSEVEVTRIVEVVGEGMGWVQTG